MAFRYSTSAHYDLMALYDMLRSKIEIINEAKTELDKIIEDINENIVEKNNSENNTSK